MFRQMAFFAESSMVLLPKRNSFFVYRKMNFFCFSYGIILSFPNRRLPLQALAKWWVVQCCTYSHLAGSKTSKD
ncbi:hypothetical protein CWS01_08900 [Niallia nealsonii]|uniref:Uncharacterized protein n=1 Tax=Niallia nealsonii TaxID=115979 RepID=A0A2N0Z3S8_9BACI|nr:hypothetical protein CWS01_08900 [Niallia nealsonii]